MLEQPSPDNQTTKVAVLASTEDRCHHLQGLLESSGLSVVLSQEAKASSLDNITSATPDVLLIDISEDDDDGWNFVDSLSEQSEIPILFNDSGSNGVSLAANSDIWAKKLAQKLVRMAQNNDSSSAKAAEDQPFPLSSTQPVSVKKDNGNSAPVTLQPQQESTTTNTDQSSTIDDFITLIDEDADDDSQQAATPKTAAPELNVWVLGASLGGPQAVRQFLSAITEDLPVAFILAQHIGANHINLLAEQLNRVTVFTVIPGKNGHRLRHGEVILTPADKEISFTDDGYLALRPAPPNAIYSPSIDNVMIEVARRFGERAGTIVFSGMGDDGTHGCEAIAEHKGVVWAQDIASCVVSSMPDHARKTGTVSYSANPEQLAEQLHKFYCG